MTGKMNVIQFPIGFLSISDRDIVPISSHFLLMRNPLSSNLRNFIPITQVGLMRNLRNLIPITQVGLMRNFPEGLSQHSGSEG
jgi:hypothetical protein